MAEILDTRGIDWLLNNFGDRISKLVRIVAFGVEGNAKIHAPIDTSALKNSIYTKTKNHDGFSQAASAALDKNPKAVIVQIPDVKDEYTANVGPCVEYGIYQELGHHARNGKFIAAHPFLVPALEAYKDYLEMGVRQIFNEIRT